MVDPEKGDRYDEAAWVDSYFTNEIFNHLWHPLINEWVVSYSCS